MPEIVDSCSLASPASVCQTKHLHLRCSVDFTRQALTGTAALTIQSQEDNLRSLVRWDERPVPASSPAISLSPLTLLQPLPSPTSPSAPACLGALQPQLLLCPSSLAPTHFSAPSSSAPLPLLRPPSPYLRVCILSPTSYVYLRVSLLPPKLPPPVPGHILVPHPRRVPHPTLRFHFRTNPLHPHNPSSQR